MVSFQTPIISSNQRKIVPEYVNSSKKRRWEETEAKENLERPSKTSKAKSTSPDIELHLEERPLPLEWQRCLDIQSGQIYFYNSRTQKRSSKDPRQSPERLSPSHMSLDLELNLSYESLGTHADENCIKRELNSRSIRSNNASKNSLSASVTFEEDHREMVAAVCMQCHMLVMLCKSSPACPSCKFMHPPDPSPTNLFKRNSRFLCCKD